MGKIRVFEIVKVHWIDATHYRTENAIEWLKESATTTEFLSYQTKEIGVR